MVTLSQSPEGVFVFVGAIQARRGLFPAPKSQSPEGGFVFVGRTRVFSIWEITPGESQSPEGGFVFVGKSTELKGLLQPRLNPPRGVLFL